MIMRRDVLTLINWKFDTGGESWVCARQLRLPRELFLEMVCFVEPLVLGRKKVDRPSLREVGIGESL